MAISCEPADLMQAAQCYKCIPRGMQPEVMIDLLNVISGLNLTPQQLIERAACLKCIPRGMHPEIQTGLLNSLSGLNLTPQQLIDRAPCFKCIPPGLQPEVKIYLLNVKSGLNLTPEQLIARAPCYKCIPTGMQAEVISYLLCNSPAGGGSTPPVPPQPPVDPMIAVVEDWAARVVANGGAAPEAHTKNTLIAFLDDLDLGEIYTKMLAVCCFVPDNLIAAITPLIATIGSDPWTNNNFTGGDLNTDGLISDGVNKYLDAGFQPSSLVANDIGFTVYNSTVDGTLPVLGAWNAATGFSCYLQNNNIAFDISYNGGNGRILTNIVNWAGYVSGNRTAANSMDVYYANSVTVHQVLGLHNANVVPDERAAIARNFYVFANNVNGVLQGPTTCTLSFVAFHRGLTQAESNNFFNAIQNMRTGLGGGWT